MPIVEITMYPEKGMNLQQLHEALIKKAGQEILRIRVQADGKIINLDARPNFSRLTKDGMTLRWRYKQYKTKS